MNSDFKFEYAEIIDLYQSYLLINAICIPEESVAVVGETADELQFIWARFAHLGKFGLFRGFFILEGNIIKLIIRLGQIIYTRKYKWIL